MLGNQFGPRVTISQKKHYTVARAFAAVFRKEWEKVNTGDAGAWEVIDRADMEKKHSEVLLCDFEAAKYVGNLEGLELIVEVCHCDLGVNKQAN